MSSKVVTASKGQRSFSSYLPTYSSVYIDLYANICAVLFFYQNNTNTRMFRPSASNENLFGRSNLLKEQKRQEKLDKHGTMVHTLKVDFA
jgi:hypothetical protein